MKDDVELIKFTHGAGLLDNYGVLVASSRLKLPEKIKSELYNLTGFGKI